MQEKDLLIVYGSDYTDMTEAILEEAQLAQRIPSKETRIGLKPNLVAPVPAQEGATTHAEVAAGVIRYLRSHGFSNLVILEGSWVGDRTQDALSVTGFDRLCSAYQVPFWDMQEDRGVKEDCAGMQLSICERVSQIGFLINLPVLKGHCQTGITCALKNMKGLIPNSEKRRFHKLGLHDPIGHLSAGIRQDFILVDSICGDVTFEDGGNPLAQNRLIAACDPVLCDSFGCSILGIDPLKVPYIRKAGQLGVGSFRLEEACIRKYVFESGALRPFTPGSDQEPDCAGGMRHVMALAENVTDVESCSACYGSLLPVLARLEQEGLLGRLKKKIAIGQGHRGSRGTIGIGSCTSGYTHSLQGCPPSPEQMYAFLKGYLETGETTREPFHRRSDRVYAGRNL